MTPILGIMASQISGHLAVPNNFESIATTTLSTTTAYIEFASIPATFRNLQIRGIAQGANGGGGLVTFNSDTGANYSYHSLYGDGGAIGAQGSASTSNILICRNGGISTTANTFSGFVIDILDYANTNKYKTTRALNGQDLNGSGKFNLESGNWRDTAAINTIRLTHNGSGFTQYTSFALYGIVGA